MWNELLAITSTLVACTALGGLFIRYALVPYFQEQLVKPILAQLASVVQIANDAVMQVKVIANAWDHHQEWSQDEVDRIWAELRSGERVVKQRGKSW